MTPDSTAAKQPRNLQGVGTNNSCLRLYMCHLVEVVEVYKFCYINICGFRKKNYGSKLNHKPILIVEGIVDRDIGPS